MEEKEIHQQYIGKVKNVENNGGVMFRLRDIHMDVESIYEDIKKNKSSGIYKAIFFILFGVSAITFIVHLIKNGFGFGLIFIIFLIGYYFYFTYNIKKAKKENIKTPKQEKIDPESPTFLKSRIQYISEGIRLTSFRAVMVRNFYIIFFPLMAFTLIDIIKGRLTVKEYFVTLIVSILIGGIFWFYYFKNDITDIENDIEELKELKIKIEG